MTFESGFMAFALLFIVVVIGLVADATLRAGPAAPRWHRPVGFGILGLLTALAAGLAWWWLGGGK